MRGCCWFTHCNLHVRHGIALMSDLLPGATRVCSLDQVRAWNGPEPTKWAVVDSWPCFAHGLGNAKMRSHWAEFFFSCHFAHKKILKHSRDPLHACQVWPRVRTLYYSCTCKGASITKVCVQSFTYCKSQLEGSIDVKRFCFRIRCPSGKRRRVEL